MKVTWLNSISCFQFWHSYRLPIFKKDSSWGWKTTPTTSRCTITHTLTATIILTWSTHGHWYPTDRYVSQGRDSHKEYIQLCIYQQLFYFHWPHHGDLYHMGIYQDICNILQNCPQVSDKYLSCKHNQNRFSQHSGKKCNI